MSFEKTGIVEVNHRDISNMYTGKQTNVSNGILTYDYQTDIFKDYGFNTCTKLSPVSSPSYWNGTKQFMVYSYLLDTNQTDTSAEYAVSLYAYVSTDCDANFRLVLEHSNLWIQTYTGTTGTLIEDSTKGKVIWVWGRFKPSPNDGKIYLMFYPNPNQVDKFTKGYQLFTGITVYKGTDIIRPVNNNISGTGIIQATNASVSPNFITATNYIET